MMRTTATARRRKAPTAMPAIADVVKTVFPEEEQVLVRVNWTATCVGVTSCWGVQTLQLLESLTLFSTTI